MWIICSASPSAALKIRGNNQQITQNFTHPLFSFMCWMACAALSFFPEILHLLWKGSRRKGAPPQPNSAHPEVKGTERADWLWTPVPSRHTTGWGRWHPPGNHLLPAVLHCSSSHFLFLFFIPLFKAGSHFSDKKQSRGGESIHCGQMFPTPTGEWNWNPYSLISYSYSKLQWREDGQMMGMEWKGGGQLGASRIEVVVVMAGGGGVSSKVILRGRRAAREAGCYGLFSPGLGATCTRCALPSAPSSAWFIATLADASVQREVFESAGSVCVSVGVCARVCVCASVLVYINLSLRVCTVDICLRHFCICVYLSTWELYELLTSNLWLELVHAWPQQRIGSGATLINYKRHTYIKYLNPYGKAQSWDYNHYVYVIMYVLLCMWPRFLLDTNFKILHEPSQWLFFVLIALPHASGTNASQPLSGNQNKCQQKRAWSSNLYRHAVLARFLVLL